MRSLRQESVRIILKMFKPTKLLHVQADLDVNEHPSLPFPSSWPPSRLGTAVQAQIKKSPHYARLISWSFRIITDSSVYTWNYIVPVRSRTGDRLSPFLSEQATCCRMSVCWQFWSKSVPHQMLKHWPVHCSQAPMVSLPWYLLLLLDQEDQDECWGGGGVRNHSTGSTKLYFQISEKLYFGISLSNEVFQHSWQLHNFILSD